MNETNPPVKSPDVPAIQVARPSGPRPAYKPGTGRPPSGPRSGGRPMGGPGGARPSSGPGGAGARRGGRPVMRRKVCRFCAEKIAEVDYKAIPILRGFLTARGKILASRTTGNCARHQRQLTLGIKRSRMLALLPYTGE